MLASGVSSTLAWHRTSKRTATISCTIFPTELTVLKHGNIDTLQWSHGKKLMETSFETETSSTM